MAWSPADLSLKEVTINGEAATASQSEKEVTIAVKGAGFASGITLVFVQDVTVPAAVIPVNNITLDPGDGYHKLSGTIAPTLKNCGRYALVAWLPPPGPSAQGIDSGLNDVAILEQALSVTSAVSG